ncbi:MAG: thiosulfohydrolase SoxB [Proteobacteria bacterium]|nr:thiosulfohydrolase SoxB [Pseudomonadota bacterium]
MNRREFLGILAKTWIAASASGCTTLRSARPSDIYHLPAFGQARILHITDTHAQLYPVYFREPNVNLGIGAANGRFPHRVGRNLLDAIPGLNPAEMHALTYLDFSEAAERYGRVGGFAHLATLLNRLRGSVPDSLLLDGGDTWQGSGTALWTGGQDMVGACNLLGVDVMTGHWEFTYAEDVILKNVDSFNGDFVAQNIKATEDALFEGVPVFDEDSGHVFPPYVIKTVNGRRIAVIGQAFPYTPIANPRRFIPNWTFGIQEQNLDQLVDDIRRSQRPDAIILLSHNGMDVDLKLASRVSGVDFIMGGHTHDGVPVPVEVKNPGGVTVVTNAGSNGKFVSVLDLEFGQSGLSGYRYRLLPVFANLFTADPAMEKYIDRVRAPYAAVLDEELAVTDTLLYRRGNFNGTFDQVICDALMQELDAEIALSPGFRWGTSVLPGDAITMERLLDQTCMTYPETYVREMRGSEIRLMMESVADNLFNPDPYYQQGGDMVRTGGLSYVCTPAASMGNRITEMKLRNGRSIVDNESYKVAGWATVGAKAPGEPVWEVVAAYLRDQQIISLDKIETPVLKGVSNNPGIADYFGDLT